MKNLIKKAAKYLGKEILKGIVLYLKIIMIISIVGVFVYGFIL